MIPVARTTIENPITNTRLAGTQHDLPQAMCLLRILSYFIKVNYTATKVQYKKHLKDLAILQQRHAFNTQYIFNMKQRALMN